MKDVKSVMLVGVAGGSGSGKTTFARMLQANLGDAFCGIVATLPVQSAA